MEKQLWFTGKNGWSLGRQIVLGSVVAMGAMAACGSDDDNGAVSTPTGGSTTPSTLDNTIKVPSLHPTNSLLWKHHSAAAEAPIDWKLKSDGSFDSFSNTLTPAGGAGLPYPWEPVGRADFNNDSNLDIVWRNATTGENAVWLMHGTQFPTSVNLPSRPGPSRIIAVDDFVAGDGKPDILWLYEPTFETYVWRMDGTTLVDELPYLAAPNPDVVAAADFNGDKYPDLLVHNKAGQPFAAGGQFTADQLNTLYPSAKLLIMDPTQLGRVDHEVKVPQFVGSPWRLVTAGLYNSDTMADLFWRNADTGQNAIWTLNPPANDIATTNTAGLLSVVGDQLYQVGPACAPANRLTTTTNGATTTTACAPGWSAAQLVERAMAPVNTTTCGQASSESPVVPASATPSNAYFVEGFSDGSAGSAGCSTSRVHARVDTSPTSAVLKVFVHALAAADGAAIVDYTFDVQDQTAQVAAHQSSGTITTSQLAASATPDKTVTVPLARGHRYTISVKTRDHVSMVERSLQEVILVKP